MNKSVVLLVGIIIVLAGIGYFVFQSNSDSLTENPASLNLDSTTSTNPTTSTTAGINGCFVGGCSGQICSEDKSAMSTCEYKEEYACYKASRCERQKNGECGWTDTPEFSICMNSVLNPGADLK